MKAQLVVAALATFLMTSPIHAAQSSAEMAKTNDTLSETEIQDMKRLHQRMTLGAASETGMEARRNLMLSKKDDLYHQLIRSGSIDLSSSDRFAADQFSH